MGKIWFLQPSDGDLLVGGADGEFRDGRFFAQVRVRAEADALRVNGVPVDRSDDGDFRAMVPLDGLRGRLEARDENGGCAAITVFRLRGAEKT